MNTVNTDNQLLAEYTDKSSEAAFRELVQRHINMVHSAGLREAGGNAELAEDITQEVFTHLARSASRLSSHPSLAGWLYTCVRQMTANARRAEHRRQRREQETFLMNELLGPNSDDQLWQQVRPVLDDVMHELDHEDRTAVVLRFFEGLSLKEVGVALGLNENAARMRVERSLEKLHARLSRRGIHSTASTLAAVFVAGTVLHSFVNLRLERGHQRHGRGLGEPGHRIHVRKNSALAKTKTFVFGSAVIFGIRISCGNISNPSRNPPKIPGHDSARGSRDCLRPRAKSRPSNTSRRDCRSHQHRRHVANGPATFGQRKRRPIARREIISLLHVSRWSRESFP